jgi:hypothetical protein
MHKKYPSCLNHLSIETCGGPFLPTKQRLDVLAKVLQNVEKTVNQEIKKTESTTHSPKALRQF